MTLKKIVIGTSMIIIALLLYVVIMFIAAFGGFNFLIRVPEPEIKYGEFPFKLTYEIDGETKIIEDVIVCEFDGFKVVGEAGKYRKWKSYLKSGNEEIVMLDLRPQNEFNEFGHAMLELFFYWGNAEYYMGDFDDGRAKKEQDFKWIEYKYKNTEGGIGGSAYKADEAYEKYKIRLISWEAAPPIENEFK